MASTIGGADPHHALPSAIIEREERRLRAEARKLLGARLKKERQKKLDRANEISRRKSKRAHEWGQVPCRDASRFLRAL